MMTTEQVAQLIYEASDEFVEEGVAWEDMHGAAAREARRQAAAVMEELGR